MIDRRFKRKKGLITIAQNNKDHNYLRMAYALALSLKNSQTNIPYLSVCVSDKNLVPKKYYEVFDEVIEIPWGDHAKKSEWKVENKWKYFFMTPYEETIILDTDMLFFNDISDWWEYCSNYELLACTNVYTYRQNLITNDFYRKTFTSNKLPNIYTAFLYFKQTEKVLNYFKFLEIIFNNWEYYFYEFLDETRPKFFSSDVAFSLGMKLLNLEDEFTNKVSTFPKFIHMKSQLQDWNTSQITEEWTKHIGVYINSDLKCKIGQYNQLLPLHYHDKNFLTDDIIKKYERKLME